MAAGEMAIIDRTYLTNPGDWEMVVMNMRNNLDKLTSNTIQMYKEQSMAKLKTRCRDKFGFMMRGKCTIEDPDIRLV